MFFSKYIVAAVAAFGFIAPAIASPVAAPAANNELVARTASSDALLDIQALAAAIVDICADLTAQVDVEANVNLLITKFDDCKDSYSSKPSGVLVGADITVFISICVDILVKVFLAIAAIITLDLSIYARLDLCISAWISVLNIFLPGCASLIGAGLPAAVVTIIASLKLDLCAKVLVLVNIFGILGL